MPPAYLPSGLSRAGLDLLLEAFDSANDVGCEPKEFAVKISYLRKLGVSIPALNWLIGKGYADHLIEVTAPVDEQRTFRTSKSLRLFKRSCFALSKSGADLARSTLTAGTATPQEGAPDTAEVRPEWDARAGRLTFGKDVVLKFSRAAPNERAILDRFQELGWPPRIDDPLPGDTVGNPKRRLHNTINALNRKQIAATIRFSGDGTGRGVCWCPHNTRH